MPPFLPGRLYSHRSSLTFIWSCPSPTKPDRQGACLLFRLPASKLHKGVTSQGHLKSLLHRMEVSSWVHRWADLFHLLHRLWVVILTTVCLTETKSRATKLSLLPAELASSYFLLSLKVRELKSAFAKEVRQMWYHFCTQIEQHRIRDLFTCKDWS